MTVKEKSSKKESQKKPVYKKWWFWVIIVFVLFAIGGGSSTKEGNQSQQNDNTSESKPIEYLSVNIDTLEDDLKNNAASAKEKYNGKYLEISGRLGTIDSDLKYIGLLSASDKFDLVGVHCTLKDDNARNMVKSLNKDQNIIVRGKITDVGEVLGYYLDVTEIIVK